MAFLSLASPASAAPVVVPASSTKPVLVAKTTIGPGSNFVAATVTGQVVSTSVRSKLLFGVRLQCDTEAAWATTNVLKSKPISVRPQRVFKTTNTCRVYVQSSSVSPSDKIAVTVKFSNSPVSVSYQNFNNTSWPKVVLPGKSVDVLPYAFGTNKNLGYFRAYSTLKVTSCQITTGSRENGSGHMCTGYETQGVAYIRSTIYVQELATAGGYCATTAVTSGGAYVTYDIHHGMSTLSGTFKRSGKAGCSGDLRAKLHITNTGKVPFVIHARGTGIGVYR